MNRNLQILARILAVSSGLTLLACYVARSQRQQAPANIRSVAPGSKSMDGLLFPKGERPFAPGSKSAPIDVFTQKGKLPIQSKGQP